MCDPIRQRKPKYVVLDIETSGLSPKDDCILEIGAIAVDDELRNAGAFDAVVPPPGNSYVNRMSDYVRDMHTKSGLMPLIKVGNIYDLDAIDRRLSEWLVSLGYDGKDVTLAGHTISFDHAFIKEWLPLTGELLSHRTLDFSALGIMMNEAGYDIKFVPKDQMPHRAFADALIELNEFRSMVSVMQADRSDAEKYREIDHAQAEQDEEDAAKYRGLCK